MFRYFFHLSFKNCVCVWTYTLRSIGNSTMICPWRQEVSTSNTRFQEIFEGSEAALNLLKLAGFERQGALEKISPKGTTFLWPKWCFIENFGTWKCRLYRHIGFFGEHMQNLSSKMFQLNNYSLDLLSEKPIRGAILTSIWINPPQKIERHMCLNRYRNFPNRKKIEKDLLPTLASFYQFFRGRTGETSHGWPSSPGHVDQGECFKWNGPSMTEAERIRDFLQEAGSCVLLMEERMYKPY